MTESILGPPPIQPEGGGQGKKANAGDVQQFLQVQGERSQLNMVLSVAETMVGKQLDRTRQETANLDLKSQDLPPEGDAEQQGAIHSFNYAQQFMGPQLNSLVKQIGLLKAGEPELGDQLNDGIGLLQKMAKAFPKLSQDDVEALNRLIAKLHSLTEKANPSTQAEVWSEVSSMYQKLYKKNEKFRAENLERAKGAKGEELGGAEKTGEFLDRAHENLGAGVGGAAARQAANGALPNQFAHAILGKYLPRQEKYLMALAELLMFDNMGANIGNMMLNKTLGFESASTDFNFSGSLHSSNGAYKGNPAEAKRRLASEKAKVADRINQLQQLLKEIEKEIKKIRNNPKLSTKQKNEMIGKLQKEIAPIKMTQKSAEKLQSVLKTMKVVADGSDKFKIEGESGWLGKLGADENTLVNGVPGKGGGLLAIHGDITTFLSYYSGQQTQMQMMLQLKMTEQQQMWTAVSTALQVINSAFMSVAQGINK